MTWNDTKLLESIGRAGRLTYLLLDSIAVDKNGLLVWYIGYV